MSKGVYRNIFFAAALLFFLLCGCGSNLKNSAGGSPRTAAPAASPSETPDGGAKPAGAAEPSPEAPASPEPDGVISVVVGGKSLEVPAYKARGELRSDPPLGFEMYVAAEAYGETADKGRYRYAFTGDESGQTFVEISFISGSSAEELAPSFLNDYIDFTSIEFSSYEKVGRDGLSAYKINANGGGLHAEAYLIDTEGGAAALVISCRDEYLSGCLPYLAAMLDTFALVE